MENKKLVLAFSGGLDTTYCAIYLSKIEGYEVHAACVNTGGFSEEEIDKIKTHAQTLGIKSFTCIDARERFYKDVIKYLIFGNILKNNTYPLSVSAERIIQAVAIAEFTQQLGAAYIAHGSTGAGNDQVRFDMVFNTIIPSVKVITPIRDHKLSREDEIQFLKSQQVVMDFDKATYSINKGLWGTSVGGKETLSSHLPLPENAWPTPLSKQTPEEISLLFEKGELVGINNQLYANPVEAINALQAIAAPFAIGRDIHVGDTIIGIKGRVGFEAAAPMLIIKGHHAIEKHTLTKWQLYWKDQLSAWYGNWMHEGQFLDPVMRDMEAFFEHSQNFVSGTVFITLKPYHFQINGITSNHDLMSAKFGSYGEMNNTWSGEDVKGFAKIFGNQTTIHRMVNNQNNLS